MRQYVLSAVLAAVCVFPAHAQTKAPSADGDTPAVATPDSTNPTAPVAGANSFTEDQAKARLEDNGYTDVTDLKLDANGVWQGSAMKDSKQVMVSLDYQGNIVAK